MRQVLCLLFLVHHGWACDKQSGPSGTVQCIMMPRYNYQYQWATCLTDKYIKQKSSHQHVCEDSSDIYCWYQCMLEVHSKNNGPVTKDCSCTPSQTTIFPPISPISPTTSLPSECYSPSGELCNWYKDCLEKKYPCEATSNAYALKFAEKFCRLYNEKKSWFSEKGQRWVDGVRKCLQVSLVPLLRPWSNPTCQEIRKKAFASHTPCYLNPDRNVPSVCDLDCIEYNKIFFIIKGSFIDLDTAWESIKGMWNIGTECGLRCSRTWLRKKKNQIIMKIIIFSIQKFVLRKRRSSDPIPEADARSRFVNRLGSAIAVSLKWNKEAMDWLAFPGNLTTANDSNTFDIFMVLVDKKALGIVNNSNTPIMPPVDLNSTIQTFASAIEHGNLSLQVDGFNVWLKSMASCSDKSCKETQTLAVSDKPPKWPHNGAAEISTSAYKETQTLAVSDKPPKWPHNGASQISTSALKMLGITAIALAFMMINKLWIQAIIS